MASKKETIEFDSKKIDQIMSMGQYFGPILAEGIEVLQSLIRSNASLIRQLESAKSEIAQLRLILKASNERTSNQKTNA